MGAYTSYYLYQKYEKRGNQDWIPCYPNVYSINGGGSETPVIKEENDTACGYVPSQDQTRNVSGTPWCENYNLYVTIQHQESHDGGTTWTTTATTTEMIEYQSEDCGYVPVEGDYLTFVAQEDGTFAFTNAVDYSLDSGSTWTTLAANTNTPTIGSGSSIMWKAELTPENGIGTFSSSGNFIASGNPLSLLFGNAFSNVIDLTGYDYAFKLLFNNCTKLTSINDLTLQATTLAEGCYAEMFFGCTSLTTIPSGLLPSMTLATKCYEGMFEGCTSLTTVPSGLLKANTVSASGYCAMFQDCTSLATVENAAMRATTMSEGSCQDMFNRCSSLTSVSNSLFADVTTLAYRCFYCMFYKCTSLQTAPNLLMGVLAERCFEAMFYDCARLSKIVCLATDISANGCTKDWVSGVQTSNGRFIKDSSNNSWTNGYNGIPNNWTIQNA